MPMTDPVTPEEARRLADSHPAPVDMRMALRSLAAQLEAAQKENSRLALLVKEGNREIWAKADEQQELATQMFNERQLALAAIQDALGMLATGYPNRARDRLIEALPSRVLSQTHGASDA